MVRMRRAVSNRSFFMFSDPLEARIRSSRGNKIQTNGPPFDRILASSYSILGVVTIHSCGNVAGKQPIGCLWPAAKPREVWRLNYFGIVPCPKAKTPRFKARLPNLRNPSHDTCCKGTSGFRRKCSRNNDWQHPKPKPRYQ